MGNLIFNPLKGEFNIDFWSTASGKLYYMGGNVGIGTTNPQGILSVANTSGAEQFRVVNTPSATTYVTATGGASANPSISVGSAGSDTGLILNMKGNGALSVTSSIGSAPKLVVSQVYNDTNYLTLASGATGAYSSITASGTLDANTGINITGKGTGNIILNGTTTGNVGIGTTAPNASSLLDVESTTKGFLPPQMTTTQKAAISTPKEGLVVYDLTLHKLSVFTGTVWETVASA